MISAVAWLPRGVAKPIPELAQPSEEELAAAQAQAHRVQGQSSDDDDDDDDDDDTEEEEEASGDDDDDIVAEAAAGGAHVPAPAAAAARSARQRETDGSIEAALAELDMEHYDDDGDEDAGAARLFGGSGRPTYYASNEEDPYITLHEEEDEEELSDFTLRPTDLVLLAARTEDDVSHLEVWVYEEAGGEDGEANLFVHHDLLLPAFPLALAWLDCPPGAAAGEARGNFVAVGTMLPAIELWDLDVLDATEPVMVLGGEEEGGATHDAPPAPGKKAKKGKRAATLRAGSHKDAVLGVAWNAEFRNVLASASADCTVKVWDVAQGACQHTMTHHTDKVQAVVWNPSMASVLLSGGFDHAVAVADVRTPGGAVLRWPVSADVECAAWNPSVVEQFLVSTEDGHVACHDARKGAGAAPLFTLAAHDKPTSTLALCPRARGLLATGSTDKATKLWDISRGAPELLVTRDLRAGAVFSAAFSEDAPQLLAVAGAKGTVTVWDVSIEAAVAARWGAQLAGTGAAAAPAAGPT